MVTIKKKSGKGCTCSIIFFGMPSLMCKLLDSVCDWHSRFLYHHPSGPRQHYLWCETLAYLQNSFVNSGKALRGFFFFFFVRRGGFADLNCCSSNSHLQRMSCSRTRWLRGLTMEENPLMNNQ